MMVRMVWIGIMLMFCFAARAQEASIAYKPLLFGSEVHLQTYQAKQPSIVLNGSENKEAYSSPVFRLQQPDRLPVFCAIEKRISQKFNFPVRIRLDDGKYEYH